MGCGIHPLTARPVISRETRKQDRKTLYRYLQSETSGNGVR